MQKHNYFHIHTLYCFLGLETGALLLGLAKSIYYDFFKSRVDPNEFSFFFQKWNKANQVGRRNISNIWYFIFFLQ